MKKSKRVLSLLLCLVMLLSLFPTAVFAETEEATLPEEFATDSEGNLPGTPDEPETPDESETPAEPETPDESETPDEPETPDETKTPDELETPDEPESVEEEEAESNPEVADEPDAGPVRVVFECTPEETIVTVYDPAQLDENDEPVVIEPEEDGSWLLLPGTYLYDAECEGYEALHNEPFDLPAKKAFEFSVVFSINICLSLAEDDIEASEVSGFSKRVQASSLATKAATPSTTIDATPYPIVVYEYTPSISVGVIRYISQSTNSNNFHSEYWPSEPFGKYTGPGNECATASTSMALSYIGINKTPKEILEANNGVTYYTGWGATHSRPAFLDAIENYINGNGKYSPPMIHIPKGSSLTSKGHFIIVVGRISSTQYFVLDPSRGKQTIEINGSSIVYQNVSWKIDEVHQWYNANAVLCSHEFETVWENSQYKATQCKNCHATWDYSSTRNSNDAGIYRVTSEYNLNFEPYADAKSGVVKPAGWQFTAIGSVTNAYLDTWYETEDHYYVYSVWAEYVSPGESTLAINPAKTSYTIQQGSVCNVTGTITSNYNITKVTATLDGRELCDPALTPNAKSLNIGSSIINSFKGAELPVGTHHLIITATDSSPKTVTKTITIKVDGEPEYDTCTIVYNDNGGTGGPGTQAFIYGGGDSISTVVPTREGYTFVCWIDDYTGYYYYPDDSIPFLWEDRSLTAQWRINSYNLELNFFLDGSYTPLFSQYGYVTLCIDGQYYYQINGDWQYQFPYGAKYEFTPTYTATGYSYSGVRMGSISGTIGASDVKVQLDYSTNFYTLDINGYLDGSYSGALSGYGTVDVYVNGSLVAQNADDYCVSLPYGTSYEIKNICPTTGHQYNGVNYGSLSGYIGENQVIIYLAFSTCYYDLDINGLLDGVEAWTIDNFGTVDIYINGALVQSGCSDFSDGYGNGKWPYGTTYELKNIHPAEDRSFDGYSSVAYEGYTAGSRTGTITGDTSVRLIFHTCPTRLDVNSEPVVRNGHTYYYFSTPVTWYDAKTICENMGGHLATINSADEDVFLLNYVKSFNNAVCGCNAWLGGTDRDSEGTWTWITGEPFSYTNWYSGEPNNGTDNLEGAETYLHFYHDVGGLWNDVQGCDKYAFICEVDSASYVVQFDANGGTGSMKSMPATIGVPVTLPQSDFVKEGFSFVGWNLRRDSDNTWYVWGRGFVPADTVEAEGLAKMVYSAGDEVFIGAGDSGSATYTYVAVWETTRIPGDVTGDGVVNGMDLIRLRKFLAGKEVEINALNADVTGDGTVNGMDLIRLRKYLAGKPVELN